VGYPIVALERWNEGTFPGVAKDIDSLWSTISTCQWKQFSPRFCYHLHNLSQFYASNLPMGHMTRFRMSSADCCCPFLITAFKSTKFLRPALSYRIHGSKNLGKQAFIGRSHECRGARTYSRDIRLLTRVVHLTFSVYESLQTLNDRHKHLSFLSWTLPHANRAFLSTSSQYHVVLVFFIRLARGINSPQCSFYTAGNAAYLRPSAQLRLV